MGLDCCVFESRMLAVMLTLSHFTFWISLFALQNRYVYSQAAVSKFILIIVRIYMFSNIYYYYYTKRERSDADE